MFNEVWKTKVSMQKVVCKQCLVIVNKLERNIHEQFMNKANVGLANLKKTQWIKVEILLRFDAHNELGKQRDNTT
jgi:hypothetical protein